MDPNSNPDEADQNMFYLILDEAQFYLKGMSGFGRGIHCIEYHSSFKYVSKDPISPFYL